MDPTVRSLSILYVDDDPLILDVVRQTLGHQHDILVETALSAQEALEKSEMVSYDAIVSDYQMPGMNGLDFLKEVRSRSGEIPFILFTGRGREEVAIEAINLGVDFYIRKGGGPGSRFTELAERIRQAIRRRRAEEALMESEERFRELAENSSDLVLFANADLRFCYVSPSFESLTGYLPDEALGQRLDSDHPGFEGIGAMVPIILKLPPGTMTDAFPVTLTAKDGKTVVFEMRGAPVFSNGAFRGIQVVGKDVTERKRSEAQIIETMERLSCQDELLHAWQKDLEQREGCLVEAGLSAGGTGTGGGFGRTPGPEKGDAPPDQDTGAELLIGPSFPGVVTIHDSIVIAANEAFTLMTGAGRPADVAGRLFPEFIDEEDLPAVTGTMKRLREECPLILPVTRVRLVGADGRRTDVEVIFASARMDGKPMVRAFLRDVTGGTMEDRAVRSANLALNRLSSVMRHDLMNSYGLIAGWIGLLKEECTAESQKDYISRIETAGIFLKDQVAFTKEYQDLGTRPPLWHRLAALVEGPHTIPVSLLPGTESLEIYADPLVSKVISAIIENAGQHGKKATAVTMSVAHSENGLILAIEDDGAGIAPERKSRIFMHEFGKKTRFGLFISREVLSVTGMSIRETGIPGAGARFEITMPAGTFRFSPRGLHG